MDKKEAQPTTEVGSFWTALPRMTLADLGLWRRTASSQMSSLVGHISQPFMMISRAFTSLPVSFSKRAAAIHPAHRDPKHQNSEVKHCIVTRSMFRVGRDDTVEQQTRLLNVTNFS